MIGAILILFAAFIVIGFFYQETVYDEYDNGEIRKRKIWRFFVIPQEKRAIVERWKRHNRTVGPGGPFWRIPIIERVRAVLPIYEQEIELFDRQDTTIDFRDGSAKPVGVKAFFKISDPAKAIYNVRNWKSAFKSQTESLVRSYLNGLTLDEALARRRAGFDIAFQIELQRKEINRQIKQLNSEIKDFVDQHGRKSGGGERSKESERDELLRAQKTLKKANNEIQAARELWGVELTQIFIRDLELSPRTVEAREEEYQEERKVRAAAHRKEQMIHETAGLHAAIRQELIRKGYAREEVTPELVTNIWTYYRGTEKGSIIDIRAEEGLTALAAIAAAAISAYERVKEQRAKEG